MYIGHTIGLGYSIWLKTGYVGLAGRPMNEAQAMDGPLEIRPLKTNPDAF